MSATTRRRAGIAFSRLVIIFLIVDAALHVANVEVARTAMSELGCR